MPADRRVTITYDRGGTSTRGEYAPDNVTVNVWASRLDTSANRLLEAGGARGAVRRTYRIRYLPPVVEALEAGRRVRVVEAGNAFAGGTSIVTVAEPPDTRRRFLDITVEGST